MHFRDEEVRYFHLFLQFVVDGEYPFFSPHVLGSHLPNCLFLEGQIIKNAFVVLVQRNKKQFFIVSQIVS